MHQKLVPDPLFILINNSKQPLHAMSFFKTSYFERGLSKTFFLSNPVSFNGQSYQKQKWPGNSDLSLFRLRNKFTKIYLLVIYYLTKFDGIIQSSFWVIPNIAPANLCKPINDIINYSTSICLSESGKWGKEEKKLQKIGYLENEKSFLDEMKKHFSQFLKGYHLVKK